MFNGTTAALNISHRHKHWQTQKTLFLYSTKLGASQVQRRVRVTFVPFLCSARRYQASSTSWAFHRRAAPLCPPSSSPRACHPGCYLQGEDGGEDLQRLPGAIRAAEWNYYVGVSGVRGDVYFVCLLFFGVFFQITHHNKYKWC